VNKDLADSKEGDVMKRIVSVAVLGTFLASISPEARAQNCSSLSDYDVRGTYTVSGSGWIDLSKFLAGIPGLPPLPTGLIPQSWVAAVTWNGARGGGGWVSFNGGGNQMTAQLVGMKYSVNSDCSVQMTFSMKINELPQSVPALGPFTRLMVPVLNHNGMSELQFLVIWQGTAPGTPTSPAVDSGVAHRISTQY
jgi:hypothetical protein